MRGQVEDCVDRVVQGGGEGKFGGAVVVDGDKNGGGLVEDHVGPVAVVGCISEAEATAVEVDDDGVAVAGFYAGEVVGGNVEV